MEEEQDDSQLRLALCGSSVAQMEALASERNPLHGRLTPLVVEPVAFASAGPFLSGAPPLERIARFAISGGMPRYLTELAGGHLRERVVQRILDRNGPLWNEARAVIGTELRQPATYFSILEQLASGGKEVDEIAQRSRVANGVVSR